MLAASAFMLRHIFGKPLQRLETAVQSVAICDFDIVISDTGRTDEVGRLADNLDRMRNSLATAKEIADNARADQVEQEAVIDALTQGLKGLASGDLTSQISQEFSAKYAQPKGDYNETARTLHDTLCSVVENARVIRQEFGR